MLSENQSSTSNSDSFANRTTIIPESPALLDDGDEISLETDNIPPSKLRLSDDDQWNGNGGKPINSIEDHQQFDESKSDNRFAQISPEPPTTNFKIIIQEFEKRGEGINAFIVYKIEIEVEGIVGYTKKQYEVWRRFSDFLGLHEKIVEKYLPKGLVIPIPPEKSIAALTKTKNSDPSIANDVGVRRARQLQRFMQRLVQHPRIRSDCDVRDFLTLDGDLPKANQTSALSSAGVKKMFKSFGEVFSKMAFHMEEGDRWFEQVQSQIDELDEALRKLHTISETLAFARREMAVSGEQMSKALSMLAACEESTSLSKALSSLTDTTELVSAIWQKQSDNDTAKFSESIGEYVSLVGALKEVFEERVRAWQNWQNAQQSLARKRDQKTKLDLSGRTDRSEQIKAEIDETVIKMDQYEQNFIDLSKAIREEVTRFENERRADMKTMLVEYLETLVGTHTELLSAWEKFEPEALNIRV
ncbi:unnamed protein product [Caenorhabditis angaria]|uniref:PX domain-containing protein n=1 Tax=Caenorhabditis angaria TaxID=860376 RepID=A0A9P1J462_9PELO|nr:unnamed protein product [Caenorhabditis angaria]